MGRRKSSIAIVGGGITGACAASELKKHFDNVIVFDQGQRGPGGRASHRSIQKDNLKVLPDDNIEEHSIKDTLQFDHGCQFFRGDSKEMSENLLRNWLSNGWVAPWKGRLGCINQIKDSFYCDFFGVPTKQNNDVYVGVGGMHLLPRRILEASDAKVHRGTRVCSVRKECTGNQWELWGTSGKAAFHDTKESESQNELDQLLAVVDAVIFTDISSSAESWHRASAGIPESLRQQIPKKNRIPLFSCMVALSYPVGDIIALDGFTVGDESSNLWFAARSQSKPGFPQGDDECWTLISTPSFAVKEIATTYMRDPETGEFRPQENNYLNVIPGPLLFNSFLEVVKKYIHESKELPKATYLQAQRWGSALPIADTLVKESQNILGTDYCSSLKEASLVVDENNKAPHGIPDYIADDRLHLYYAGDFCSGRNPGFETAAISGLRAARHIAELDDLP